MGSSDEIAVGLLSVRHPDAATDGGMQMNHWDRLSPALLMEPTHPRGCHIHTPKPYAKWLLHIKNALNYKPEDANKFSGNFHCEVLLAALITRATAPLEGTPRMLDQV
jgi:hypothetical protein